MDLRLARDSRWLRVAAVGAAIGLALVAFVAAVPGPSAERIALIQDRVKVAVEEIENYGIVRRFESLPPDAATIRGLKDDARQRFARYLVEPLKSQWMAATMPYLDRLGRGETLVLSQGVSWTDWSFDDPQVASEHAVITGTATKCHPFIDHSVKPPARGNPCGRKWFRVTLVNVNGSWMLSGAEFEQLGGSG